MARPYADAKPVKQAYIVLVTGKLAPGHIDKFLEAFKPLATYVAEHEEGCLAYELCMSETDPDAFIIYERYTNKEYVEAVHWKSDAFKTFQATLREAGVEWLVKQRVQYIERDVGFP